MPHVLVAYATTEGQTRRIAEHVAERLRSAGHEVDVIDTAATSEPPMGSGYQTAFLGGSVHYDRHQGSLLQFARRHRGWLNDMPTAFLSVSMAPVHADAGGVEHARHAVDRFLDASGLKPAQVHLVAGALRFTQYDFFKRLMMRVIARAQGDRIDASQDHEYTDWQDLDAFVDGFMTTSLAAG